MRKPNFFILGSPKCGTTSLSAWLAEHPSVFMSPIKEPEFFNTDDRPGVATLAEYEDLFREASDLQPAVGEASVWYLSSSEAVRNILDYQPDARFIIMVRNPIHMAPAVHAEMVLWGHEPAHDFRAAWDLQRERSRGRRLPAFTWSRRRFLYGDICAHGAQLERLLSAAPASRILIVVLDDVALNPRQEYLRVLRFLGVPDDGRLEFPIHNRAKTLRWPKLTRALFVVVQIKHQLRIDLGLNMLDRVSHMNKIEMPRPRLSSETEAMLREYFESDIELLGQLLGRNFSYWLEYEEHHTRGDTRGEQAWSALAPRPT